MSDAPVIIPVETTEQDDKIETFNVSIGENKTDEIKPHNGRSITKMEISPSGKYLVTCSEEDYSIVGWNVESTDDGRLESDITIKISNNDIDSLYVSDDKKLAYICYDKKLPFYYQRSLKIIDMNHSNQKVELYFGSEHILHRCNFNSKNEFILCNNVNDYKVIWIYSTQSKNNEWMCKRIYTIPNDAEIISISKYDKIWLLSNNYIYEWNILAEKSIKIFENKPKAKDIKISSNEILTCLKIKDEIIVYSTELEIPIVSLNINNNDVQLFNFMNHTGLYPLLLSLFDYMPSSGIWKSIMEHCWEECLSSLKRNNQLPKEKLPILPILFDNTIKYAFGILDGCVWKIKFDKRILFSFQNPEEEEIIENWYFDSYKKETYEHLNINLFNPDMDIIRALFQEIDYAEFLRLNEEEEMREMREMRESIEKKEKEHELIIQDIIKWKININNKGFKLEVFKKMNGSEWDSICTRTEKHIYTWLKLNGIELTDLLGIKLINNNDIVILTEIGISIYHFNENNKSISLTYFYYININVENLQNCQEIFSKPILPLPTYDSFKINDEWIKDNRENLLKYGVKLLIFAIQEYKIELLEEIYKKCINYFKQDLENNRMFLSIITSTIPKLNEYYPEYILRYSLETTMIIDSPSYNIIYQDSNLHLYSFIQNPQILNFYFHQNCPLVLWIIQLLIILLIFPIFIATFYILSKSHFINIIYKDNMFSNAYFYTFYGISYIFDKIFSKFSKISKQTSTPTITFMIPYIKFINYPQDYKWLSELIKPQPSPFVETINREIYKTWNGEALINFKWNIYGKYYFAIIWIGFMALLGCFTAAVTIPQQYLTEDNRKNFLIASIILGFIHLSFEIRQFIYNYTSWIRDFWNYFDIIAYLLPIYTSIYWLQTNNRNVQLLSFSCLSLNLKFLLFFRVFESFGVYFAIIISVARKIVYFLVVLLIIIISFAHAFYILLLPESNYSFEKPEFNNDPNNPWNIVSTYNQVHNGVIDSNLSMIQSPDENTNMFIDYRTALFAMYLFLTGDSSALSNWSYKEYPTLVILMVLFSFMIVVYLMNLFIGLLNMAIEEDNNRVSYLIQKAELLAEIELFYLLPCQRRWKTWFPEVIYYYADVVKTRRKVNELISKDEWNTDEFLELKQNLLKKLNIQYNSINETLLQQLLEKYNKM